MSGFNDFVQTELPKRPFTSTDGAAGQVLVRSTNALAPREMVFADFPKTGLVTAFASGNLSGHRAVRAVAAGAVAYASSSAPQDANLVLGITTGAAMNGTVAAVQVSGEMTEPSWNWVVSAPIFLGADGVLTQTPAVSGFSIVLAVAIKSDTIVIGIKQPIVIL
jgi:hypothetical protein